jgi:hypothetical protein
MEADGKILADICGEYRKQAARLGQKDDGSANRVHDVHEIY